ncbi:epimerase [Silvibacterium acidisoli]|uniref:epimerase n=1 Tax=Acidobacteriaceae bacterium ZG23-2 TaxID=2883246 RepID=UPI00406C6AC5
MMKVLIFGATGMVGQGVVRACLADQSVKLVETIGRNPLNLQHPKLRELLRSDLFHYDDIEDRLRGFDACLFCLGLSSFGVKEDAYTRITYDLTMAAARILARLNPGMTFLYISGAHTDSTEKGKSMWARVKGRTENALLQLPFTAYMFRPGAMQPVPGTRSKTWAYNLLYLPLKPLFPLLRRMFPNHVFTTEEIGRAMLAVARDGYEKRILETLDIRRVLG